MPPHIKDKYELGLIPLAIREKALEIYGIENWEPFVRRLEKEGASYISEFPYWIKIWESSIVLADHLIGLNVGKEIEILEIGAGMGIVGLFLSAFGYRVTITDNNEECLQLLKMNAEHNGLDSVRLKKLDWNGPDLDRKYNLVCGSELFYREDNIEGVIRLLDHCLEPGGQAYLAHQIMFMKLNRFVESLPEDYASKALGKTLRSGDEVHKVIVHILTKK